MPFVKGMSKVEGSGRKKGQTNRRNLEVVSKFEEICEKYGDPLEAMAEMAFDMNNDQNLRFQAMKEVSQYGYAKRRQMEITGANGEPLEVRLQLIDQIPAAIEKLGKG